MYNSSIKNIYFVDPSEHKVETFGVSSSHCSIACDFNANCGCHLKTGMYSCACGTGYHGNGVRQSNGSRGCLRFIGTLSMFYLLSSNLQGR